VTNPKLKIKQYVISCLAFIAFNFHSFVTSKQGDVKENPVQCQKESTQSSPPKINIQQSTTNESRNENSETQKNEINTQNGSSEVSELLSKEDVVLLIDLFV
jgi:hypothetical protein